MATRATVFAWVCSAWMFGCGVDPETSDDSKEIIDNLVEAGFPASDIEVVNGVVYVGGDATVSLQASREMLTIGSDGQEQYRTANVVSSTMQWILVRPYSSLPGNVHLALNEAIANYNDLSLGFAFIREPVNPCVDCPQCCPPSVLSRIDMVINPASGGQTATTSFPSGGQPGSTIAISANMAQLPANLLKHVITHELGHAIGLRHSDYYNRAISCGGSATNEGGAGVGAIHITGTPTTSTPGGSLMNSCYPSNTTGEFTTSDVAALTALY